MNDRITALEAANRLLLDLRYQTVDVNPVAWKVLINAQKHLNEELAAMIADTEGK